MLSRGQANGKGEVRNARPDPLSPIEAQWRHFHTVRPHHCLHDRPAVPATILPRLGPARGVKENASRPPLTRK